MSSLVAQQVRDLAFHCGEDLISRPGILHTKMWQIETKCFSNLQGGAFLFVFSQQEYWQKNQ